jgi:serine protease Do
MAEDCSSSRLFLMKLSYRKVIGVNTAIYSPYGGNIGIAFDIPAYTVKAVVAQLKDRGAVTRG